MINKEEGLMVIDQIIERINRISPEYRGKMILLNLADTLRSELLKDVVDWEFYKKTVGIIDNMLSTPEERRGRQIEKIMKSGGSDIEITEVYLKSLESSAAVFEPERMIIMHEMVDKARKKMHSFESIETDIEEIYEYFMTNLPSAKRDSN